MWRFAWVLYTADKRRYAEINRPCYIKSPCLNYIHEGIALVLPRMRGRQNCAIFRNKWFLRTEAIRQPYKIITDISQLSPAPEHGKRVMRACTPWSFARERMIHASGANVGGKLSNVETGSFLRVGKYRECQLPSPSPRTGKNWFCDSQFRGGSVCPCNFNLAVFRAMNPFTSDINEVSLWTRFFFSTEIWM